MARITFFCSCLLVLLFALGEVQAQSTFVKTGGTGAGTSWADAAGNLQQVLAQAGNGDEIWVATGTYRPTTCTACTSSDRNISFSIPSGVRVYGGFSGSETQLAQRNVASNPTILSGDIDSDGQRTRNSYHVVKLYRAAVTTRLDGFTIRDGYANGPNEEQHGAGIYNDGSGVGDSCKPIIANCKIINNRATSNGGGLYNNGFFGNASPTISNTSFSSNRSREGGAMHNQGYGGASSPNISRCTFTSNVSSSGGAVYNSGNNGISNPRYDACRFSNNSCTGYGGAVYNFAKDPGAQCNPTFANCIFNGNTGDGAAGAVYTLGSTQGIAEPRVVGCVFYDNYSRVGGAIYVNASNSGTTHLRVDNCIFTGSRAAYDRILHFSGNASPQVTLRYSQFDASDCNGLTGSIGGNLVCGAGLIFSSAASFVNSLAGDFHLQTGAPGIDAGLNAAYSSQNIVLDYAGAARIQGLAADMGAYEFATGDTDGDGIPDIIDNCPLIANANQIDADNDSYGAACDCNDTNASVNPGATELCDGIDNNCNGQIDESGGTISYFADADGDGFGNSAISTMACNPPAGYVLNANDCNDTDASSYPGAPEICDGLDNDCDGEVDEGVLDTIPPQITCKAFSVSAPAGTTININPQDVYHSGSDDCSSISLISVSPNSFNLPGTYTVTLTAADDAGNFASCTASVTISLVTGTTNYCSAAASQPWTEWIASVSLANLTNVSSKCGTTCGYSDYTAQVASVTTGSATSLHLTPGLSWGGYQPSLYWRVYIDWNQDGDFADAGELVASADNTFLSIARTIQIPAAATPGTTRMRVAMRRDAAPTACGNYIYGEVEDYSVSVAIGGPRVQIINCPAAIVHNALPGETQAMATWTAPTASTTCAQGGASVVQVGGPASGSNFPLGTTHIMYAATDACGSVDTCSFTVTVNAQAASLAISCPPSQTIQLQAGQTSVVASWAAATATSTCPGGATVVQLSGPTPAAALAPGVATITYSASDTCANSQTCSFTITVLPAPTSTGSYCEVGAAQPWTEWIAGVALSNVDNTSGKCDTRCGYGDFTQEVAALTAGAASTLTLTPGLSWPGHQPDLHWRVWIDWNADADFADAGELVLEQAPGNAVVTAAITPPAAASGLTRMRVAVRRDAYPLACANFVYGEVEDYGILVAAPAPRVRVASTSGGEDAEQLRLVPNPASTFVKLHTARQIAGVQLLSTTGERVQQTASVGGEIDLTRVRPGMYVLLVTFEDGTSVSKRLLVQ